MQVLPYSQLDLDLLMDSHLHLYNAIFSELIEPTSSVCLNKFVNPPVKNNAIMINAMSANTAKIIKFKEISIPFLLSITIFSSYRELEIFKCFYNWVIVLEKKYWDHSHYCLN